jgi:hypothetical protein
VRLNVIFLEEELKKLLFAILFCLVLSVGIFAVSRPGVREDLPPSGQIGGKFCLTEAQSAGIFAADWPCGAENSRPIGAAMPGENSREKVDAAMAPNEAKMLAATSPKIITAWVIQSLSILLTLETNQMKTWFTQQPDFYLRC